MKARSPFLMLFGVIACVLFQNCGSSPSSEDEILALKAQAYFQTSSHFKINVYYEPGAEPFDGNTNTGAPYWNILDDNLTALFQYRSRPPEISVPKALSEMTALPAQSRDRWTSEQLLDLNRSYGFNQNSTGEEHFQIYFVNGYFDDGTGPKTGVIGVSLGASGVIAIFKQVVGSTGSTSNGIVPRFVEQSTLVHEMGHALGFVNNGVPMKNPHQDVAHGAHTTDTDCVMYWQNEGTSNLIAFIQKYMTSSSRVMWGPNILQDAKAISR